jgi:hypothetical protein
MQEPQFGPQLGGHGRLHAAQSVQGGGVRVTDAQLGGWGRHRRNVDEETVNRVGGK